VVGAWTIWNFYFRPASPPGLDLPDRPSIAVLPFKNVSSDSQEDLFGDALAVSIVTQLYKVPNVFVIARQSSFKYKYEVVKVQQIGRELGVQYVLEGSVQREGDRIRINTQLIDTGTGNHIWAETYDRQVKDVFALQDEIIRNVITEMAVEVAWGEMAREMTHATENFEALNLYFKAEKLWQRFEKESNLQARRMLEKAIELDPNYARAIAFLGSTYTVEAGYGWVKDRKQSIKKAEELVKRALAIDECVYLGRLLMGTIYLKRGLYDQAIAERERAVECEPNNALAKSTLASILAYAGRLDEALVLSRKALRMAPYPPPYVLSKAGEINYLLGRYEESIAEYQKLFERFPSSLGRDAPWLIASYMALGQEKNAKTEVEKLLKKHPDFSIEKYIKREKRSGYKDKTYIDRQVELLDKAGLK
jgi:adenylate cyclase